MHDPSHLVLFLEIVELGSLSQAARQRGISRSTAARHLAALEDALGVQLLHRDTHALSLTQAGEVYLEHAQRVREGLLEAEAAVHDLEDQVRGRLRIAAPFLDHRQFLYPIIESFSRAYPELTIETLLTPDVRRMVAEGIDVGVQLGLEDNSSLIMRKVHDDAAHLYATPSYLETHSPVTEPADLDHQACVVMRRGDGAQVPWPLWDGGHVEIASPKLITNAQALHNEAIVCGMGIGMLVDSVAHHHVEAGELVALLPDIVGERRVYVLVHADKRHVQAKVRAFVDFVVDWSASLWRA